MILLLSDLHLGRFDPATERERETQLLRFFRMYEPDITGLFLVGDVFDTYIEYRYVVPKGFVRLQALWADWAAQGLPITYLVGNHDPWHQTYFQDELGIRVIFDEVRETLFDRTVYLAHGDGHVPTAWRYNTLKPLLRHPLPVALYRLLPSDWGYGLARWTRNKMGKDDLEPPVIAGLRQHARRLLVEESALDLVILGHSHLAEIQTWPEGQYVNLGGWLHDQTFACLNATGPRLYRWHNGHPQPVATHTQS